MLDRGLTAAEAADGVSGAHAVAAQQPFWEPGAEHGYHAQTYSWLLSELVLRVTGRTLGTVLAEEMTEPLGVDFWIGLPETEAHRVGRVAPVDPPSGAGMLRTRPRRNVSEAYADPDSLTRRAFTAIDPLPDENAPAYRAAELPASNGIGTARGLARFYGATIGVVEDGARIFTPATTALMRPRTLLGPGPGARREHPLRPRLHAARPGLAAAFPDLLRPPRPRWIPGLRGPGGGHRLRLRHQRPGQVGHRRPARPSPGPRPAVIPLTARTAARARRPRWPRHT